MLIFEAIVVVLAIPVAISLGDVDPARGRGWGRRGHRPVLRGRRLAALSGGVRPGLGRSGSTHRKWVRCDSDVHRWRTLRRAVVLGLRVGRRGEELHAERWADVDSPAPEGGQPLLVRVPAYERAHPCPG